VKAYRRAILLVPVVGGACDSSILGSTVCSMEARPAISVEVLDSMSLAPAGVETARIIARPRSPRCFRVNDVDAR
jgi:hypothetical protein